MPKERRARAETRNRRITTKEADDVEEMSSPRTPAIYEIVRRLGDEEMDRPITSLWWSGVAAGLSISFSLLAQGILQAHLPEASWTPLIGSLGYSVGFLVVLSRQQLFTESTVTAVLPVMASLALADLWRLVRLWGIVLVANLVGTLTAAALCTFTPVLTPELKENSVTEIKAIHDAIREGDPDRAEAACVKHIEEAAKVALRVLASTEADATVDA